MARDWLGGVVVGEALVVWEVVARLTLARLTPLVSCSIRRMSLGL